MLGPDVHMVSDAFRALMSPFSSEVEDFCSDVYYDIEKEIFFPRVSSAPASSTASVLKMSSDDLKPTQRRNRSLSSA